MEVKYKREKEDLNAGLSSETGKEKVPLGDIRKTGEHAGPQAADWI